MPPPEHSGPGPGLLVLASASDAAAWARAGAAERAARGAPSGPGRGVLRRDADDLAAVLAYLATVPSGPGEGGVLLLAAEYRRLAGYFELGALRLVPPLPEAVAAFFAAQVPELSLEPEPAEVAEAAEPVPSLFLFTHDAFSFATRTAEGIARDAAAAGLPCRLRDTAALRVAALVEAEHPDGARWEGLARGVRERFGRELARAAAHGPVRVASLDLHWFLDGTLLDDPRVERIVSFWFDDVKAWCQAPENHCFPGGLERLQEALRHPKVVHACYGQGQLEEMRFLGCANARLSHLAAPAAYLAEEAPVDVPGRAAFIGNPGAFQGPPPGIVALLERGAELDEIRAESRRLAFATALAHFAPLAAREPTLRDWFAAALEARGRAPHRAALALLSEAGTAFPRALAAVDEMGEILNAASFVKLAGQFDRPALVHRLYRAGLLDVHSAPEAWAEYGVAARPDVPAAGLPAAYRRYACHLNGANSQREATANEKLFEIAACGRVSVNLFSPDVAACYAEGEVALAATLEEAEARVRRFLERPEEALAYGARARERTARDHLWTHRLRALLG